jgi:hypothetical protein
LGRKYAIGLWNSIPATLAVEFILFGVGAATCVRTMRGKDRTGRYALWSLLIFLIVVYAASSFGPPPPSAHAIAVTAPALWPLIP